MLNDLTSTDHLLSLITFLAGSALGYFLELGYHVQLLDLLHTPDATIFRCAGSRAGCGSLLSLDTHDEEGADGVSDYRVSRTYRGTHRPAVDFHFCAEIVIKLAKPPRSIIHNCICSAPPVGRSEEYTHLLNSAPV